MGSAVGSAKNFLNSPVGGNTDPQGKPAGGITGTSYGGLLSGALAGMGRGQPQRPAQPVNFQMPNQPYIPPPAPMGGQFYGG